MATEQANTNRRSKFTKPSCTRCGKVIDNGEGGFWADSVGKRRMCQKCLSAMNARAGGLR